MVAGHLTLKNGRYYAVLNYRNAGGQRKTKWIALGLPEKGNKRKAEAELARLRAEFEPPKEVGDLSSDMLFADYLLEWLEIAKGRLAVATYSSYAAMIKKPVGPYFRQRNLTLRELEARHLQMFYSEMLRKVKPNTVIHYHAIIHSALKYAVKTDMLVQNVADKVDRPKKNSFQPVFLSAEEMQKMFEALRGTKLELPVLVAAFYGFRRGEVLGLKWDAIDFERGTISVIRTVTTITLDGKQTEIEQQSAKTKSSLRTLPLIGSFREYFLQVKEAQELNKQICGNCYNHEYDGFVFVDELGERMRANYLTSAFPKFLESHGLRRMRFHDLRHPYVKHTTKKYNSEKQKTQATKMDLIAWVFRFIPSIIQRGHGFCKQSQCGCRGIHTPFQSADRSAPRLAHPLPQSSEQSLAGCFGGPVLLASALPGR